MYFTDINLLDYIPEGMLIPLTAVALGSYFWLVAQTVKSHRPNWFNTVITPFILSDFTFNSLWPSLSQKFTEGFAGSTYLVIIIIIGITAGILLDKTSSLQKEGKKVSIKRSPWPLILWGIGFLIPLTASGIQHTGILNLNPEYGTFYSALSLTGGSALLGQAIAWIHRMLKLKNKGESGIDKETAVANQEKRKQYRNIGLVFCAASIVFAATILPEDLISGSISKSTKIDASLMILTGERGTNEWNNANIVTYDPNTNRVAKLGIKGLYPCLSPNRDKVAYIKKEGETEELWISASDGSSNNKATFLNGQASTPLWGPDGKKVYFTWGTSWAQGGLWELVLETGESREILDKSQAVFRASISPSGTQIAYFKGADFASGLITPYEIKLFDLQSGSNKSLKIFDLEWKGYITGIIWDPDGDGLYFGINPNPVQDENQKTQLAFLDINSGAIRNLGSLIDYNLQYYSYSPDGNIVMLGWTYEDRRNNKIVLFDTRTNTHKVIEVEGLNPFYVNWSDYPQKGQTD